jgi:aminotransferase EvaB
LINIKEQDLQQINDLSAHLLEHDKLIKRSLARVVDSGWLVLGPEVKNFEQLFSEYIGVNHCVSVANGTDAIELGLRALGICSGDQVATVANAAMYSTSAILTIGAKPFFLDVDFGSRNVTLEAVERALNAGVKAVVLTHLYGLAIPDTAAITARCRERGVWVLEDCAQAHGAKINGQCVGGFGDIASFSFYPTKNLGAVGDGGAVITRDDGLASKVMALRQYGWTGKYNTTISHGRNSRLDEMQAAVLSDLLPFLDGWNSRRRAIATRYNDTIKHSEISSPERVSGDDYVAHLYVITTPHRSSLAEHLRECEIISDIHYPIPDHRQAVFNGEFCDTDLIVTEQLAKEVLTLPCYPEMTDESVDNVIDAVNRWAP